MFSRPWSHSISAKLKAIAGQCLALLFLCLIRTRWYTSCRWDTKNSAQRLKMPEYALIIELQNRAPYHNAATLSDMSSMRDTAWTI